MMLMTVMATMGSFEDEGTLVVNEGVCGGTILVFVFVGVFKIVFVVMVAAAM